ncbi:MAG: hypothetical protein SF182_21845 [Deltaproteobacteria bacterium]|nr:hypothetical protein [Deltaproteobacteria bacterium]
MPLLLKRLLLILLAVAIPLLLLELAARLATDHAAVAERLLHDPGAADAAPRAQALDDQRVILHPYFGYVVDPRAPGINPYGFFKASPLTTRTPDRFVIAFFGGSVADQVFSLGRAALIEALHASPVFAGRQVEVLSTALGGYKQPQQLLVLAGLLALGAQFDAVVVLDGFNEVDGATDNVQDGVYPYYPHNWHLHARQALDPAATVLMGQVEATRAARAALRRRFARAPLDASALWLWIWDVLDRRQAAALNAQMHALDAGLAAARSGPQVSGPPLHFDDEDAMFVDFVEVWARASLEMHNLATGQGIQFFHFLQPNQYLEGSKTLNEEERRVAWDPDVADAGRVARGYPLLIARGRELREQGVDFHDLTMLFAAEEASIYSDPCCHYTPRGAELVARAIAQAIIERNE